MGRIVIVAYRPKPGQQAALESLMRQHHRRLLAQALVTDRLPTLMRAADGTIIEVFEWVSAAAIAAAHHNSAVQQMWAEYADVCENVPLAQLPEAQALFAEFEPLAVAQAAAELHPEFSP
jgi:quinol monooxygenase YgiN